MKSFVWESLLSTGFKLRRTVFFSNFCVGAHLSASQIQNSRLCIVEVFGVILTKFNAVYQILTKNHSTKN